MTDIPQWWMKGDWFDVCSCNIACPCEFAQPPTNNHCDGVMAYHIREGAYGDVRLDNLRGSPETFKRQRHSEIHAERKGPVFGASGECW